MATQGPEIKGKWQEGRSPEKEPRNQNGTKEITKDGKTQNQTGNQTGTKAITKTETKKKLPLGKEKKGNKYLPIPYPSQL
jgi:hypothetical protein